jgi:hypothetical protein
LLPAAKTQTTIKIKTRYSNNNTLHQKKKVQVLQNKRQTKNIKAEEYANHSESN